jgi:hypothetical protein
MKTNKLLLKFAIGCISISPCVLPMLNGNEISKKDIVVINSNQKIKITKIKYALKNYGSQRIMFEVNPKINNDEIDYSLKYSDSSDIETDIFEVLFMPSKNYIDITCLKPFDKRIILTIYAISNENVKASINIDFKEKITIDPKLEITDNMPISIDNNLNTTGGSIKIDKTISDEQIGFSNIFLSSIKEKLKERFEEKYYNNPQTTTYYQNLATYHGLEEKDCLYWFTNNFSYNNFLKSIYYEVDYSWIESDSDYESFELDRVYIYDLLEEDFLEIFNGVNSVFTYSCIINNEKYNYDLGLLIEQVNINEIKILDKDVVF